MNTRMILAAVLFVVAVLALVVFGLVADSWLYGIVFGGIFAIAGLIFLRRAM
jgi:hypothetical protein